MGHVLEFRQLQLLSSVVSLIGLPILYGILPIHYITIYIYIYTKSVFDFSVVECSIR